MATVLEREAHDYGLPVVHFVFGLIVILSIFHFGFKGGTLYLIALIPGHCLSFAFSIDCLVEARHSCVISLTLMASSLKVTGENLFFQTDLSGPPSFFCLFLLL